MRSAFSRVKAVGHAINSAKVAGVTNNIFGRNIMTLANKRAFSQSSNAKQSELIIPKVTLWTPQKVSSKVMNYFANELILGNQGLREFLKKDDFARDDFPLPEDFIPEISDKLQKFIAKEDRVLDESLGEFIDGEESMLYFQCPQTPAIPDLWITAGGNHNGDNSERIAIVKDHYINLAFMQSIMDIAGYDIYAYDGFSTQLLQTTISDSFASCFHVDLVRHLNRLLRGTALYGVEEDNRTATFFIKTADIIKHLDEEDIKILSGHFHFIHPITKKPLVPTFQILDPETNTLRFDVDLNLTNLKPVVDCDYIGALKALLMAINAAQMQAIILRSRELLLQESTLHRRASLNPERPATYTKLGVDFHSYPESMPEYQHWFGGDDPKKNRTIINHAFSSRQEREPLATKPSNIAKPKEDAPLNPSKNEKDIT